MIRQVVILAGGLATRLYPLTKTIPKSLVRVAGRPFLDHQLRLLKAHGIEEVILCVGHQSEQIIDYAGRGGKFGLSLVYSREPKQADTGGALKLALPYLDKTFFVLYGDAYLLADYQAIAEYFAAKKKLGLTTAYENHNQLEPSNLLLDGEYVKGYRKAPPLPGAYYIEWGLNIFSREIIGAVAKDFFPISDYFDLLVPQRELLAYVVRERFYEIGSLNGLKETEIFLQAKK